MGEISRLKRIEVVPAGGRFLVADKVTKQALKVFYTEQEAVEWLVSASEEDIDIELAFAEQLKALRENGMLRAAADSPIARASGPMPTTMFVSDIGSWRPEKKSRWQIIGDKGYWVPLVVCPFFTGFLIVDGYPPFLAAAMALGVSAACVAVIWLWK